MFTKVLFVCAVAAVAMGIEYPPGIHPAVCPNYPYCDMEVLARHTPQGMPIPDWELPYYGYGYRGMMAAPLRFLAPIVAAPTPAPVKEEVSVGEAPRYPADFDPALCPNYPFCN